MRRAIQALIVSVAATTVGIVFPPTASAAVMPFQIQPASYGNPNGSFDVPPIRCAVETGRQRGVVTITGADRGRWGCLAFGRVGWFNLTTGAAGRAKLSSGLNGIPPAASLNTGSGDVVIRIEAWGGVVTPGFATVRVP